MDTTLRSKSVARLQLPVRPAYHMPKAASISVKSITSLIPAPQKQMTLAKLTVQQFDFKEHLKITSKRPCDLSTRSSLLNSSRKTLNLRDSLSILKPHSLHRVESISYQSVKALNFQDKPESWDYPKSAKALNALLTQNLVENVEKTLAKGGGFTTYGLIYQNTPKRVPFLLSKRDSGFRSLKKHTKLALSLGVRHRWGIGRN